jgi:hypothetical protein
MWKLTVGILAQITTQRNKKVYNAGNLPVYSVQKYSKALYESSG